LRITYGRDIDEAVNTLRELVQAEGVMSGVAGPGWTAVKLLEGDEEVTGQIRNEKVLIAALEQAGQLEKLLGEHPATIMADRRYGFISGACQEAVRTTVESRHTTSDRIDEVVMSEAFGIPILLVMMYGVFYFTFTLGAPMMSWIEWAIGQLGLLITTFWPVGTMGLLRSLVVDGIIGGVGGVIVFLPNIVLLFLAIAMLEDTGYMARAAFTMDRLMHRIGLHGKSFIPLLIGFGCTVPAIMATRILDSRRERLITMLIAPLMSCGARLTIYAMLIPAFFPRAWQAPVLWIIYVTGVLLAILSAKLLSKTMFRGQSDPFVMELPPYRMPTAKSVVIHMWERAKQYLRKAGTIILAISIVLWVLSTFPRLENSSGAGERLEAQACQQYAAGVSSVAEQISLSDAGAAILADSLGVAGAEVGDLAAVSRHDSVWIERFMSALREAEDNPDGTIDMARWRQRVRPAGILADAVDEFHNRIQPEYQRTLASSSIVEHQEQLEYSVAGRLGRALETVLKPLGLDWKVATALVGAFAAKEVFVAQMGIIYAVQEAEGGGAETLRTSLRSQYSTLQAVCILLFCLIGTPCMATIAVTRKESGSWGWAALQWGGLTGMAYVITLAVYQLGMLAGLGG
jgi:ferrous iron transport protein B